MPSIPSSTFQASYIDILSPKMKLNIHLTKSAKGDRFYKFCLYTLEEHKIFKHLMLNINILIYVPKLKYSTQAQK